MTISTASCCNPATRRDCGQRQTLGLALSLLRYIGPHLCGEPGPLEPEPCLLRLVAQCSLDLFVVLGRHRSVRIRGQRLGAGAGQLVPPVVERVSVQLDERLPVIAGPVIVDVAPASLGWSSVRDCCLPVAGSSQQSVTSFARGAVRTAGSRPRRRLAFGWLEE